MTIGERKKWLAIMETYFIPAGTPHNWKTLALSAKILDVVAKQSVWRSDQVPSIFLFGIYVWQDTLGFQFSMIVVSPKVST